MYVRYIVPTPLYIGHISFLNDYVVSVLLLSSHDSSPDVSDNDDDCVIVCVAKYGTTIT